ncbi:hypothetical protein PF003_g16164 [Phytophthora fragariae]|nr:hypothetical protein PF003_g16164 [Phytophthora fragariae]
MTYKAPGEEEGEANGSVNVARHRRAAEYTAAGKLTALECTSREPAKPGPPDGSFHACLTSFMARRQQRRGHSHSPEVGSKF